MVYYNIVTVIVERSNIDPVLEERIQRDLAAHQGSFYFDSLRLGLNETGNWICVEGSGVSLNCTFRYEG